MRQDDDLVVIEKCSSGFVESDDRRIDRSASLVLELDGLGPLFDRVKIRFGVEFSDFEAEPARSLSAAPAAASLRSEVSIALALASTS